MPVTTTESLKPSTTNGRVVEAPKETVVPEPKQVDKDEVEIELFYEFVNNYTQDEATAHGFTLDPKGRVVFGPGKVTVTRAVADDLMRRQLAAMEGERAIVHGSDHSTKSAIAHLG